MGQCWRVSRAASVPGSPESVVAVFLQPSEGDKLAFLAATISVGIRCVHGNPSYPDPGQELLVVNGPDQQEISARLLDRALIEPEEPEPQDYGLVKCRVEQDTAIEPHTLADSEPVAGWARIAHDLPLVLPCAGCEVPAGKAEQQHKIKKVRVASDVWCQKAPPCGCFDPITVGQDDLTLSSRTDLGQPAVQVPPDGSRVLVGVYVGLGVEGKHIFASLGTLSEMNFISNTELPDVSWS